jgi:putative Mg2+ transporter-C (MgtC) family protein
MNYEVVGIILRLGAAAAAGVIIGINRDLISRSGCGRWASCPSVLRLSHWPRSNSRIWQLILTALSRVVQGIIQGIMAGISFIGAGVILRDAQARTVEGLTTAATVWVTAALGIACGLAAWTIVGVALFIALILLVALGWMEGVYSTQLKPSSTAQQK